MGAIASQITSLTIVYSIVYSDTDQRKHQSSASLAFVRGIHRGPVNSPHKWPVTWKMFPFDDVIITWLSTHRQNSSKSYWCLSWGLYKKNEFAFFDIPSLIESVLTRVLTSATPNLRNAYKYITHMTLYFYNSPPDTREVRISTRNIFPFKWYNRLM